MTSSGLRRVEADIRPAGCVLIAAVLLALLVLPAIALWGLIRDEQQPQLQVTWVTLRMGQGNTTWTQQVPCVWRRSWHGPTDTQCLQNLARTPDLTQPPADVGDRR